MAFDTLTLLSHPKSNYIGTTLFLAYIAFALYFTTSIALSLYRQKKAVTDNASRDAHQTRSLVILALFSFITLSYHMSSFLLQSFLRWNLHQDFFYSNGSANASFGTKVWKWMLESTLFEDFAKELVRDGPSTIWTQISLSATWFWNLVLAREARTHGLSAGTMAPYIVLSQILPVSFTATLVLLHLQLLPPKGDSKGLKKVDSKTKGYSKSPKKDESKLKRPIKKDDPGAMSAMIPTVLFSTVLLVLPSFKQSGYFMPIVLFTRLLLLIPHRYRMGKSTDDLISSGMLAAGFAVANVGLLKKGYTVGQLSRGLRTGGESVKALSWDAIIGLVVAALA
ncbi:hypothetical protein BDV96DRAFT_490164 [Lophiotrema nucula]|uniref:Uncharacterized protein n=1 Tax=Lophiotrema nucula TaxID=690887 RepID=A0A6A5ZFT5_9PLEO|nr:hypothetical protein BDV96DRAFT_490164 [Lophiotrema nucula]